MKHQAPSTKLQRSTKQQTARSRSDEREVVKYPKPSSQGWTLQDGADGQNSSRHAFDLDERTARFGEAIVRMSKRIPRDPTNNRLIDQLVGCGTSVGTNYREANESVSKKDFRFSISRCVKETKFFLRMVAASEAGLVEEARRLYRECHELHMIFASIYRKGRQ